MIAESGVCYRSNQAFPGHPVFIGADGTRAAHLRRVKSIDERELRPGRQTSAALTLARPDSGKAQPSPARTLAGNAAARTKDWEEF